MLCTCLLLMAGDSMAFVKGLPSGWLQTSPTVELPSHACGLHKIQIPQHFLHGSQLFFPEGLLVLSLYHSSPRAIGTVSRGLVTGAGTWSQHCQVGKVYSVDQSSHWSALSAECWALRLDTH